MSDSPTVDLSILLCAYNMQRELPRTLMTLSLTFQQGVEELTYEVLILDNGSTPPVEEGAIRTLLPNARVIRPASLRASPAYAINEAMRSARGRLVGLWIDGARMASPGVLRHAVQAWRSDPKRAIATLGFHLGPDVQMRTVLDGYNAAAEDKLLATVPWQDDGYRLFDISVLAGSSSAGWFGCINETNGLFLDRTLWDALGGFDERFEAPGGGFVNLDLWERAVALSGNRPWMILGEGTFHQVHGGVATNGPAEARTAMRAEYAAIHNRGFTSPLYQPQFVGALDAGRFDAGARRPLDRHRKVHSVRGRHFRVDLPTKALNSIQSGTLRTRYKGRRLAKSPFDLAHYMQLVDRLRPQTIIEVGTSEGGSALWFADQCRAFGLDETRIVTIDVNPPPFEIPGVRFHQADSTDPERTFPTELIEAMPHPWLVVEDSAHSYESASAVLAYFDARMRRGDMLVLEDGILADLEGKGYRALADGPNRALADFLRCGGDRYQIDAAICDFYGHNVTYSPNGWLRRL
ncbi:MAG: CmcI family methyltransferase [Sphingomicrobium sp.]